MRSRSGQRSESGVLTFWALGTRIIEPDGSNSGKMLSKAWLRYGMCISVILRKLQGQGKKRSNFDILKFWKMLQVSDGN